MTRKHPKRFGHLGLVVALLMSGSFAARGQEVDFDYRCVIVDTPTAADQGTDLPVGIAEALVGSTFHVE